MPGGLISSGRAGKIRLAGRDNQGCTGNQPSMSAENPPPLENKDPLAPSNSASPEAAQPSPPNRCEPPVSKINAFQTFLPMVCMLLFLVMYVAFLCFLFTLLEVNGAWEYAPGTLTVCCCIVALAALILAFLYPLRRRVIVLQPNLTFQHPDCILLGCTTPFLAFFWFAAFVAWAIGGRVNVLPVLAGPVLFILFLLWLNRIPAVSPNHRARTLRLFIPNLPYLILIGLPLAFGIYSNCSYSKNLARTIETDMTADGVKKVWGEPLWSSEEAMIYATRKDQLVVVILAKSYVIEVCKEDPKTGDRIYDPKTGDPIYAKRTLARDKPVVLRIVKLDTNREFVEGFRHLLGGWDGMRYVGYRESGTDLRVVDSSKASVKTRERLTWLIQSGSLKEQIAKTPAIVEEIRSSDR